MYIHFPYLNFSLSILHWQLPNMTLWVHFHFQLKVNDLGGKFYFYYIISLEKVLACRNQEVVWLNLIDSQQFEHIEQGTG